MGANMHDGGRSPYTILPDALIRDASLSMNARLMYALLATWATNGRDKQYDGDEVYPALKQLVKHAGCSKQTASKALAELEKCGLIEVRQTMKGNRYALRLHTDRADADEAQIDDRRKRRGSSGGKATQRKRRLTAAQERPSQAQDNRPAWEKALDDIPY